MFYFSNHLKQIQASHFSSSHTEKSDCCTGHHPSPNIVTNQIAEGGSLRRKSCVSYLHAVDGKNPAPLDT